MKCFSYESFFANFANRTKLAIILALRNAPLSVTELAKSLNEEQSKVSHNLKKLTACHILDVRRKGKQRIYSLNNKTVIPILKIIERHATDNCLKFCPERCKK